MPRVYLRRTGLPSPRAGRASTRHTEGGWGKPGVGHGGFCTRKQPTDGDPFASVLFCFPAADFGRSGGDVRRYGAAGEVARITTRWRGSRSPLPEAQLPPAFPVARTVPIRRGRTGEVASFVTTAGRRVHTTLHRDALLPLPHSPARPLALAPVDRERTGGGVTERQRRVGVSKALRARVEGIARRARVEGIALHVRVEGIALRVRVEGIALRADGGAQTPLSSDTAVVACRIDRSSNGSADDGSGHDSGRVAVRPVQDVDVRRGRGQRRRAGKAGRSFILSGRPRVGAVRGEWKGRRSGGSYASSP